MKKKFRLCFNIVTICLCMCAIAIGVYAATNASLTVSGTIGFTAHGCDIDASGYIYGHKTTDESGNEFPQSAPANDGTGKVYLDDGIESTTGSANLVQLRNSNKNTGSLSIGEKYFTDMNNDPTGKPTDIVIVLTISNQSLFPVYGIVSATSNNPNIDIQSTGLLELKAKTGTEQSPVVDSVDVTIILSVLPDENGNYNEIDLPETDNIQIAIDFDKGNLIKGNSTYGYYVEMGTVEAELYDPETDESTFEDIPIRWYVFAKEGAEGTYAAHSKTTAISTGNYYFISYEALAHYEGISWVDDWSVYSGHYSDSEPYGYVQDLTIEFANEKIFKAISGRDFDDKQSFSATIYDDGGENIVDEIEVVSSPIYNQKLWNLSATEAGFISAADRMVGSSYQGENDPESEAFAWWLRDGDISVTIVGDNFIPSCRNANFVDNDGSIINGYYEDDSVDLSISARPAFQLNIAKNA